MSRYREYTTEKDEEIWNYRIAINGNHALALDSLVQMGYFDLELEPDPQDRRVIHVKATRLDKYAAVDFYMINENGTIFNKSEV